MAAEITEPTKNKKYQRLVEIAVGAVLFLATAAVVVWQNSRVGVLWDLSYILENANRISLGDVPYRDFPFPYAPVTFLVQAALIKLTGAVFWHHILYCAIIGGLGTVLAWRIIRHLLDGVISMPRTVSFILSLPLVILGIYCVYPHPFYDPDCTFAILLCVLLLLHLEATNFPWRQTFLVGILLVIPLFIKQNTGLAFLGSLGLLLLVLIGVNYRKKQSSRGIFILLGGLVTGLLAALAIIESTAGLANYKHWTLTFAAERRTPSLMDMASVYLDSSLILWLALFAIGVGLIWFNKGSRKWLTISAICLMLAPFVWSVCYLFLDADSSERAERLVVIYPYVLILSLVSSLLVVKRRAGIKFAVPFILIATMHGAFLSQQLWGSTYALWTLLIILIAGIIRVFYELSGGESALPAIIASSLLTLCLIISGSAYVLSNERLEYVDLSDGERQHSQLPQLKGLSVTGSYLPDFEELVAYTDKEIPKEDGILMLPGEDLFYYTTSRQPHFPVLMFDHTVNPYSSDEILAEARARDIRWLIIKNDLQLDENPLEDKDHLLELLKQDFKHLESLNNYEIYRRRLPGEVDDEDDNSSDDQSDDNSDNQSDDSNNDNSN